jgi:SET domain-containing protein
MQLGVKASISGGLGTFAEEPCASGSCLFSFSGEVVSRQEINRRIKTGIERPDDPLQIAEDQFLDLDVPSLLFNHSCDPNAAFVRERDLIAIRHIQKGEEITFDYATCVGKDVIWSMPCNCKSRQCRNIIGNVTSIPKKQMAMYISRGLLPNFIVSQISLK